MKFKDRLMVAVLVCVTILGTWNIAMSGNITANGVHQGDLVTFLTNVVTMCNELKSDSNLVFANGTALENLANETKADFNLAFVNISTLNDVANETKADYNLAYANITAIENLINELKADYNNLHADYSSLKTSIEVANAFADITATTWVMAASTTDSADSAGTQTAVASADATGTQTRVAATDAAGTATVVSTTDLTLTGL